MVAHRVATPASVYPAPLFSEVPRECTAVEALATQQRWSAVGNPLDSIIGDSPIILTEVTPISHITDPELPYGRRTESSLAGLTETFSIP